MIIRDNEPSKKMSEEVSAMMKTYDSLEFDELDAARVVELTDEAGLTQAVEVVLEVPIDDQVYAIVTPVEPPVLLLERDALDPDAPFGHLTEEDFVAVQAHINNALIPMQLKVEVREGEFTLIGDIDAEAYEEADVIELEYDGESIELLIVVTVDDAEHHYMVALPLEPVIYPARLVEEKAYGLTDEELSRVEQHLYQEYIEFTQDEMGEEL